MLCLQPHCSPPFPAKVPRISWLLLCVRAAFPSSFCSLVSSVHFPSIPQHYLTHGSCPKASLRCQQDHSAFHGLMEHMEPVHIQVTPLCLNITQRNHSEAMSRASVCIQPFAHHVNGGQGTKTSSINTMTGISLFLGWA